MCVLLIVVDVVAAADSQALQDSNRITNIGRIAEKILKAFFLIDDQSALMCTLLI